RRARDVSRASRRDAPPRGGAIGPRATDRGAHSGAGGHLLDAPVRTPQIRLSGQTHAAYARGLARRSAFPMGRRLANLLRVGPRLEHSGEVTAGPYRWLILILLLLGATTAPLMYMSLGVLLPSISDELSIGPSQQGWIGASQQLGSLFLL